VHKILIIDDDDQIRKMYELFLESEGYQVLSAASGEEGLRTFWKNEVDLVITDLFMPGIDGLYVTAKIREVNESIPILGISGGPDPNNPNRSLSSPEQMGAIKVLKKPVELDVLLSEIQQEIEDSSEGSDKIQITKTGGSEAAAASEE